MNELQIKVLVFFSQLLLIWSFYATGAAWLLGWQCLDG